MDKIIKSGIHCGIYKTNGDTLNTPYSTGKSSLVQSLILSYGTYTVWAFQVAFPVGGTSYPMFWRVNNNGTISDWSTGFLPLIGGTLTGTPYVERSGPAYGLRNADRTKVGIYKMHDSGTLQMFCCDSINGSYEQTNRAQLLLYPPDAKSEIDNRLVIGFDGSATYKIYGEHNITRGTGSASSSITNGSIYLKYS